MVDTGKFTNPLAEKVKPVSPEELINKLRRALARDGDFPTCAKVVNELKLLVSDPKTAASQITEVILREPSLGTRVLHLVNSSFYRRSKPIMTVSQAVIQIGMKPLADLCASLILLQKFVPVARQGGAFAGCLRRTILTSLLAGSIAKEGNKDQTAQKSEETGYLVGTFAEIGTLLLAYYFPQLYEAVLKRAESKNQSIAQSIKEITGLTPLKISLEIMSALDLPAFYRDIVTAADAEQETNTAQSAKDKKDYHLVQTLGAAQQLSEAVSSSKTKAELDQALQQVQSRYNIETKTLGIVLNKLPTQFKDHCTSIELTLPSLPEYVTSYEPGPVEQTAVAASSTQAATTPAPAVNSSDEFAQFVDEIKRAVEEREPTASIITTVMETFAWSLGFDRVLLLLLNSQKNKLVGRMFLGKSTSFDPKSIMRLVGEDASPYAPDVIALRERRPIFTGEPLLKDGWPIAVIPVGFGSHAIGVVYADKIMTSGTEQELGSREQAAITMLAELLNRSITVLQK